MHDLEYFEYTLWHRNLVEDFECGNEDYETELSDWIRFEAEDALKYGTKIWLYRNQDKDIVGYSSLGKSKWKYPYSSDKKTGILVIPALAIASKFQKKPEGAKHPDPWQDNRYCFQIIRHLIDESIEMQSIEPLIGLFVHPRNVKAAGLYRKFDFQPYPHVYHDKKTQITYSSMIRLLPNTTTADISASANQIAQSITSNDTAQSALATPAKQDSKDSNPSIQPHLHPL